MKRFLFSSGDLTILTMKYVMQACLVVGTSFVFQPAHGIAQEDGADDPADSAASSEVDASDDVLSETAKLMRQVEGRLSEADVLFGSLNEVDDLVEHPQLAARGRWLEGGSPAGPFRALAHPLNLSEMPQRSDPVPALGEQTAEIARELGYTAEEIAELRAAGAV